MCLTPTPVNNLISKFAKQLEKIKILRKETFFSKLTVVQSYKEMLKRVFELEKICQNYLQKFG